jgi:predicted NBD/HSP70 family sugar kinase
MMYRLALDIGATQTKIGIMDEEGIPRWPSSPFPVRHLPLDDLTPARVPLG